MNGCGSAGDCHGFYEVQHLVGLLHPRRGIGNRLDITDDAGAINDHRGGALDEEGLLETILLVNPTIRV